MIKVLNKYVIATKEKPIKYYDLCRITLTNAIEEAYPYGNIEEAEKRMKDFKPIGAYHVIPIKITYKI
jgi:hypothetical protein